VPNNFFLIDFLLAGKEQGCGEKKEREKNETRKGFDQGEKVEGAKLGACESLINEQAIQEGSWRTEGAVALGIANSFTNRMGETALFLQNRPPV